MKQKIDVRFFVILIAIMLMGLWRIITATTEISVWANFSPIGAMALFGGSYFASKSKAYSFPLLILFVSDFVLMQTIYAPYRSGILYEQWYWTYGSFAVMVLIGDFFIKKVSVRSVLVGGFLAAFAHFILSNFGVWLKGGFDHTTGLPYTKDWTGLVSCYVAAIPYFKNLFLGNIVFGALFFGAFEFAKLKFSVLRINPTLTKSIK